MSDWKQHHANEADNAVFHPLVQQALEEFADNMGFALEGLPKIGLLKIAAYSAMVARAQALGFDPELLRLTPEEADSAILLRAAEATLRGVPVYMLDGAGPWMDGKP